MKRLFSFLIMLCCAFVLEAQTTAASQRTIVVDAGSVHGALNRNFNMCVGAGRANEGLRADWQRQLRYTKQQTGFRYIRMHGLLTDDMGVYRRIGTASQYTTGSILMNCMTFC